MTARERREARVYTPCFVIALVTGMYLAGLIQGAPA